MNIFDNAQFDNFNTAPRGNRNSSLGRALSAAIRFADLRDHWLYLYGQPGVGKKHLCYAVRNHLRPAHIPVNLIDFHDFVPWLRMRSPNYEIKLEAFQQVDVLIIDNLEDLWLPDEQVDQWARKELSKVLNARLNGKLPTLLSAWQHPSRLFLPIPQMCSDTTLCSVIEIVGEDYRQIPQDER
jgi:DNA replication protein DnaC